jgi:hypothetical protein
MAIATYQKGDAIRITGTFTNASGGAIDPTAVLFWKRTPTAAASTYTYGVGADVSKTGTGVYTYDIDADTVGTWYYGFYSTGTGQAAYEGKFIVAPSQRP